MTNEQTQTSTLTLEEKQRIAEKISKLYNLERDDAATQGEIDNAISLAASLMEKYQISQADIESQRQAQADANTTASGAYTNTTADAMTFEAIPMDTLTRNSWQGQLASSLARLVGGVFVHFMRDDAKHDPNFHKAKGFSSKPCPNKRIYFHGTPEDIALTIDLYQQWSHVISTLAIAKYGTAFRKEGGAYAIGFVAGIAESIVKLMVERNKPKHSPTGAIVLVGTHTSLGEYLKAKRGMAQQFAENTMHTTFSASRANGRMAINNNVGAYYAGKTDGAKANVSVTRQHKLT